MKILKKIMSAAKNLAILIIIFFVIIFLVYLVISCMMWIHYNELVPLPAIMFALIFLCVGISAIWTVIFSLITGRMVMYDYNQRCGKKWGQKTLDISKKRDTILFRRYLKFFFYVGLIAIIIALLFLFLPSYL